jgi:serine/threonine protein kinase
LTEADEMKRLQYSEGSWEDSPEIHPKMNEQLFQVSSPGLVKLAASTFDSFILQALTLDPSKRSSAKSILSHSFLAV